MESQLNNSNTNSNNKDTNSTSSLLVPAAQILPIPVPSTHIKKGKQTAQKAAVFTCDSYRATLAVAKDKKTQIQTSQLHKHKRVKRQTKQTLINVTSTQENEQSICISHDVTISVNENDWFCYLCNKTLIEDMIQCLQCRSWVHESCAGVLKKCKLYYCPQCDT